ncbi:unnamed protein product, partial [Choristocarpus tenellus]
DQVVLSASSPDEEALVLGASYFGVEFVDRIDTNAIVCTTRMPLPLQPDGEPVEEKYDVLHILGFNSVRKRMSVVVRSPEGEVHVLTKGADTTMIPLLRNDTDEALLEVTMKHMDEFALEGLRTLMVGSRVMPEEEYFAWDKEYDEAINDLKEVEAHQLGKENRIDKLMIQAEQ